MEALPPPRLNPVPQDPAGQTRDKRLLDRDHALLLMLERPESDHRTDFIRVQARHRVILRRA